MDRTYPRFSLLAALLLLMIGGTRAAHSTGQGHNLKTAGLTVTSSGFEENKGQVRTMAGNAATFVRYRMSQGNTTIFLLNTGIAYQFNHVHYPEGYATLDQEARRDPSKQDALDALGKEVRQETYRMDMLLEGANMDARITAEGRSPDHTRYYTQPEPGPMQTPPEVYTYSNVTYHEIYPGIDWVIYTTPKGMKYDFVLHPYADTASIRMRFKDNEELEVDATGRLVHGNQMGSFTEDRPVSFQKGKEVATRFVLDGDRLTFALDSYDISLPLTIDPDRLWATYYGSAPSDFGMSCTVDDDGNVYLGGDTRSSNSIADGGHQETIGDTVRDAFLVKFNPDGVRQWGTYYGGSGEDYCTATAVDAGGNVFLAGYTNSPEAIASGGYQNMFAGLWDAFLVKFNSDGVRQWGTYYGGTGSDRAYACAVESDGSVYLGGGTSSLEGIASGGYQNVFAYGGSDGFLVKFNTDGERQWATYYGGPGDDFIMACIVRNGSVYITGQTTSASGIAVWWGHQANFSGWADAFLAKFNTSGVRQWATYYGGPQFERGNSCAVDAYDNVYMAGHTSGSDTLIAAGGHQNVRAGGNEAYLVKFSSSGVRQWGTYYGGPDYEINGTCTVDAGGNVYLAGTTTSATGIASGGYQDTFGGFFDSFLAYFAPDGVLQWATYYGGGEYDTNYSCAADGNGNVYMAGMTKSPDGIASGGYQDTFGGEADAYLVKFSSAVLPTGVSSPIALPLPFSIWPNPNSGDRFFLQAEATGIAEVRIFDALGKLLSTQQLRLSQVALPVELAITNGLVTGLYIVRVTLDGHTMAVPLMVE